MTGGLLHVSSVVTAHQGRLWDKWVVQSDDRHSALRAAARLACHPSVAEVCGDYECPTLTENLYTITLMTRPRGAAGIAAIDLDLDQENNT